MVHMHDVERWYGRFRHELWEKDVAEHGWLGRILVWAGRIAYGIIGKFFYGQLTLHATSLVYTTLLSLVPLLAVSFSLLKAFGIQNVLEPFLMDFLAPLGEQGVAVAEHILRFVRNIDVAVLGIMGVLFLFYTVISLVQKIEEAFNEIWHVPNTRSVGRRFTDYLSVILIGPLMIAAAITLATTVMSYEVVQTLRNIEPFGTIFLWIGLLLPFVLVCGVFAFIYGFIPNTRVRIDAALVGGLFTGVLWFVTAWIFAAFVVGSTNYPAIYAGFASAILFMIWLYIAWLIILVGAQVSFYWQNPQFIERVRARQELENRQRERLALAIMTLIGQSHYNNEPLWTKEALAAHFGLRSDFIDDVLRHLEVEKLIMANDADPPGYLPARDIETIRLNEVVSSVRGRRDAAAKTQARLSPVRAVMGEIDSAIVQVLRDRTVKSLVLEGDRKAEEAHSAYVASGKSVPHG